MGFQAYHGFCRKGYLCIEGSSSPTPEVPPEDVGRDAASLSRPYVGGPCPKGHYCPSLSQEESPHEYENAPAVPVPCDFGTHADKEGTGEACPKCPAGRFCAKRGSIDGEPCPQGHYCPEGTVAPLPCPVGSYSKQGSLSEESECTACAAGRYCGTRGLSTPSELCRAGFVCGGGSGTPAPLEKLQWLQIRGQWGWFSLRDPKRPTRNGLCPPGHYCP